MQQTSSKLETIIIHKKMKIIIVEIIDIKITIIVGMIIIDEMIEEVMIEGVMIEGAMINIENEILKDKKNKTIINKVINTIITIIEMI